MKLLSARLWFLLMVTWAAASQARADYMNWSYSSDPNVPGVTVGSTGNPSASVTLTDYVNKPGGSSIPVIAYLTSSSSTTPVTFSPSGIPPTSYNLALAITDDGTHDTRTLNFTGLISGTLSATSSTLTNMLTASTNSITFDGHTYTVSIPSVSLADPTSPQQNIYATVSVTDASGGSTGTGTPPVTTATPEPASLLLGCLGFSLMGVRYLRKRPRRLA